MLPPPLPKISSLNRIGPNEHRNCKLFSQGSSRPRSLPLRLLLTPRRNSKLRQVTPIPLLSLRKMPLLRQKVRLPRPLLKRGPMIIRFKASATGILCLGWRRRLVARPGSLAAK